GGLLSVGRSAEELLHLLLVGPRLGGAARGVRRGGAGGECERGHQRGDPEGDGAPSANVPHGPSCLSGKRSWSVLSVLYVTYTSARRVRLWPRAGRDRTVTKTAA